MLLHRGHATAQYAVPHNLVRDRWQCDDFRWPAENMQVNYVVFVRAAAPPIALGEGEVGRIGGTLFHPVR